MDKNSRWRRRLRPVVWETITTLLRPTTPWRVLPDYLVVGTQRGGTTSLQKTLSSHPNIASSRLRKGVHFFDTSYHRGLSWYRLQFPTRAYARWIEWRTGAQLRVGEASPYYMFHPLAAQRIHDDLPGVKLIVLLRDPVERAISHHKHEVRRGNEALSLSEALQAETERLAGEADRIVSDQPAYNSYKHQTFSYATRGDYAEQIADLLGLFGQERVLILSSEQLFNEPDKIHDRILNFLDVPPYRPDGFPRENPTGDSEVPADIRHGLANRFAAGNNRLFELLGERFEWQ